MMSIILNHVYVMIWEKTRGIFLIRGTFSANLRVHFVPLVDETSVIAGSKDKPTGFPKTDYNF